MDTRAHRILRKETFKIMDSNKVYYVQNIPYKSIRQAEKLLGVSRHLILKLAGGLLC